MDIIFYSLSFLILKGVIGDEVKSVSVMEGDSVTLYSEDVKQKDDLMMWSYGPDNTFVARINGKAGSNMLSEDERFKDRVKLDEQTGDLIITNIRPEHSGGYTLKISRNNKASYKKFNVMVNGVFGDEVKSVSVMDGDSVTLYTDVAKQKDDLITWYYGPENTFVARINGKAGSNKLSEDERFKDRLKLDDPTGDLIITNIRPEHTGLYTLKISRNDKASYKKFNVMMFNGVIVDEVKLAMEGDSVTLQTNLTELQRDDELEWRFKEIRIARIKRSVNINRIYEDNDETQRFRDRLKMNNQTGDLIITNIRSEHTGDYILKIQSNNKVSYKKFNVTVYGVFGDEVKSVSVMEGKTLTLQTDITEIQSQDVILWYYGAENTLVARINRKARSIMLSDDERFRDKVMVDDQTGDLTITNITPEHSGCYNLKIRSDNKISYKKFNITVTDQTHLNIGDVFQTCSDSPVLQVVVISVVITLMLCVICIIIIYVYKYKSKKAAEHQNCNHNHQRSNNTTDHNYQMYRSAYCKTKYKKKIAKV